MIIQLRENFYNLMNLILLGDDPNHDFKDVLERWENQLGAIKKIISNVIYFTTPPQEGGKIHRNHNLSKKLNTKLGNNSHIFSKTMKQIKIGGKRPAIAYLPPRMRTAIGTDRLKNEKQKLGQRMIERQYIISSANQKYRIEKAIEEQSILEDKTESLIQSISCALLFQSFSMKFIFEIYKKRRVADITDIMDANQNISLLSAIYYTIYNLHQGNVEVEVCNKVEGSMVEDCNTLQDNKNNPNMKINNLILLKFLNFCKTKNPPNSDTKYYNLLVEGDIFVSNAEFNELLNSFLETNAIGQCINEYVPKPNRGGGYKQKGGENENLNEEELKQLILNLNLFKNFVENTNNENNNQIAFNIEAKKKFESLTNGISINYINDIPIEAQVIFTEAQQNYSNIQLVANKIVSKTSFKFENAQNELKESAIELENAAKLNNNPTLLNFMSEIFRKNSSGKKVSQTDLDWYNSIRKGLLTLLKQILTDKKQYTSAGSVDSASGNPASGSSIFPVLGKGSRKIKDLTTYTLNGYSDFIYSLIEGYTTIETQNAAILDKIKIKKENEVSRLAAGGLSKIEKETKDVILNWVTTIALRIAGVADESRTRESYPIINLTNDNNNNDTNISYMHNKVVNMLLRLVNRPSYSTNNDIDTQLYEAIKNLVNKRFPNKIIDDNKSEIICQATVNTNKENLRTSINNAAHLASNYKDKTEICPYSAQGDGQPNCTENTSIGRTEKGNTDVQIGFDNDNSFRFTLTGNQDGAFTYTLQIITNKLTDSTIMITPDKTKEFEKMSGNGTKLVAHKTLGITLNSLEELISELEDFDWDAILDEHVEDVNLINKTFEHIYTNKKQAFLNSISNIWFKMLGDCMQEFNAVFKNGGYTANPIYEPLIAKWIEKSAIRGFFANDRPSAVRFILWLLFGDTNGRSIQQDTYINQNAYGGYFSKEDQFIVGNIANSTTTIKNQICSPQLLLQGGRKTKKNRK